MERNYNVFLISAKSWYLIESSTKRKLENQETGNVSELFICIKMIQNCMRYKKISFTVFIFIKKSQLNISHDCWDDFRMHCKIVFNFA